MSPNNHRFWTQDEENQLKDLVHSGAALETAAKLFNRSEDAVLHKIKRLRLRIPDGWQVKRPHVLEQRVAQLEKRVQRLEDIQSEKEREIRNILRG